MSLRHGAILLWYACVGAALYLHNWWSFALLAVGLALYFLANSLGTGD